MTILISAAATRPPSLIWLAIICAAGMASKAIGLEGISIWGRLVWPSGVDRKSRGSRDREPS